MDAKLILDSLCKTDDDRSWSDEEVLSLIAHYDADAAREIVEKRTPIEDDGVEDHGIFIDEFDVRWHCFAFGIVSLILLFLGYPLQALVSFACALVIASRVIR